MRDFSFFCRPGYALAPRTQGFYTINCAAGHAEDNRDEEEVYFPVRTISTETLIPVRTRGNDISFSHLPSSKPAAKRDRPAFHPCFLVETRCEIFVLVWNLELRGAESVRSEDCTRSKEGIDLMYDAHSPISVRCTSLIKCVCLPGTLGGSKHDQHCVSPLSPISLPSSRSCFAHS